MGWPKSCQDCDKMRRDGLTPDPDPCEGGASCIFTRFHLQALEVWRIYSFCKSESKRGTSGAFTHYGIDLDRLIAAYDIFGIEGAERERVLGLINTIVSELNDGGENPTSWVFYGFDEDDQVFDDQLPWGRTIA